jgi:hypothetical protein
MSRKGRRDCRVGQRKKNNINTRVEEMQKAIRKAKKEGKPVPDNVRNALAPGLESDAAADAAAAAAEVEAAAKTPASQSFLASMRSEAASYVEQTRAKLMTPAARAAKALAPKAEKPGPSAESISKEWDADDDAKKT